VELLSSCKPVEPFSLNKKKTTSCVQLPTYAENVPLPYLLLRAVLRPRAAAVPIVQQSIDISYLSG